MLKGNLSNDMHDFYLYVVELVDAGYPVSRMVFEFRCGVCRYNSAINETVFWELLYKAEKKAVELEAKRERREKKKELLRVTE